MIEGTPTRPPRHPRHALNARSVQAAKPAASPRRLADGGGLYLLVSPSGAKSWVLRTVVKGRRCDLGLGSLDTRSLAEARDEAARLRRIARHGGDPLAERRRELRSVPTFEEAVTKVHTAEAATFRNAKHRAQWLSSLQRLVATFGQRSVSDLTSGDVMTALTPIWSATPETGRRVLQRVRHVFEWCKAHGYYTGENPAAGLRKALPKHKPSKEHHAALPYAEMPTFIKALREHEAIGETVRLALEFTILTASRTSEVLNAQWAEFDVKDETWTVPGARMKAGVDHRVPLTPRCLEILKAARALSEGPYVFAGRSPKRPLSNMAFLMALRRMQHTDITAHGFRSTFRDWAAERTNFPTAVCEAALAHTIRNKTEAAYNRTDLFDKRRELMETWARFATTDPAKVVAITGRRGRHA